jgi:formiminotetrahydrofolate cyclodeaminase
MDADVEAYNKLSKAMREKKGDAAAMDEAYKEALVPPFDTCKAAAECLELCAELSDCGNKNLITDTAIAAIMLEGAFLSAKFNVYINLKYIKDTEYIAKVHGVLLPLEESIPKLKEEIIEKCEQRF